MNGVSFRKEDYSKAKISFNLSKQHEDNALSLRKKNLNEFFAQKRKLKSDISNNLIQRTPNEKGDAELFSIITEKNTKRIFEYINSKLSKKELEVLKLFLSGLSYEEIAERTGTSVKSVDNSLQRVRQKIKHYSL